MVFYLVGLGLGDEEDITVKGFNAVKKSSKVYLEHYTSILGVDIKKLEAFYGREIVLADRDMVENKAHQILKQAATEDVALLVVGDPFAATTHSDLVIRAKDRGIPVQVVHNSSVMTAVAATGLQLYSFGVTVSIPFFTKRWRPDSFYEKIRINKMHGMHTLCLLDIKVKEQSEENLLKGIDVFEPPRYMTAGVAIQQLLECEEEHKQNVCTPDTQCVIVARLGLPDQVIVSGTLAEMLEEAKYAGGPLHSLVLPGEQHILETEMLEWHNKQWRLHREAEKAREAEREKEKEKVSHEGNGNGVVPPSTTSEA